MIDRIADGSTDLVFDYLGEGHLATANGESLQPLGDNLGLNAAAFHGQWRLCRFLIENGADVKLPLPDTGEMPLHAALSSARPAQNLVAKVLLAKGADPNRTTKPSVENRRLHARLPYQVRDSAASRRCFRQ